VFFVTFVVPLFWFLRRTNGMTGMRFELAAVVAFLLAYLVGSLPFGLIVARLFGGIDIRQQGSGNIGATNVARVLGAKYGGIVLVLDCLKGAAPTALLPLLFVAADGPQRLHLAVLSGVATILGHMFPCWLGFRGGKGVATALGVALVLAPAASGVAFAIFAVCFAATRIVSLSSILGASAFCGFELWLLRPTPFGDGTWSVAAFSAVVPVLIIVRHRTNLLRLCRGEEPRFRFGKKGQDGGGGQPADRPEQQESAGKEPPTSTR
jgi:glycerol-3-phosphate acyltransferase PlsY